MPLSAARVSELAQRLEAAALARRTERELTETETALLLTDAYDVQWALRQLRIRAGARLSGLKMGLTSRAKMKQMGVDSPIYGFLLDEYAAAADGEVDTSTLIHPRVEPEIALVTAKDLRGPGCTIAHALAGLDLALPA